VASIDTIRERLSLQRYFGNLETADQKPQTNVDQCAVPAALEKLRQNPEPEAGFMLVRQQALSAYDIQAAVARNLH
jgi:transposase